MRCRWSSRGNASRAAAYASRTRSMARSPWAWTPICQPRAWARAMAARKSSSDDQYSEPVNSPSRAVRLGERRRPAGEGAVRVELHRPDRQPVVAEPPGQPEGLVLVELRRDRHERHADAEQASPACRAVAIQLATGDLGVDDRRDAGGERGPAAAIDVAHDLLERRIVMEPRAVVPDVDRRRDDELLGGVEAVARQPASLVADEAAALRIAASSPRPRCSSPRLLARA